MSDNLPAVRQTDTDSWVEVIQPVGHLAERIHNTEFVPKGLRGSAPATAAAILYGREVGLGPMTSLAGIAVVDGRPTMSAELLRSMVFAAGHEIVYDETSGSTCTVRGRRAGSENWTKVTWTLDMARAAELTGKSNWKKYPRAMLVARATAELCRLVFPDVTHGMHATEELETETPGGEPGGSAPESRTTVRRKSRTKGGDGAAPAPTQGEPDTASAAPSSPPMPPLPGEPDAANELGGTASEPHPGPAADQSDDTGSGPDLPAGNGEEAAEADGPDGTGADRVEPAGERPQDASPSASAGPDGAEGAVQDEDRARPISPGAHRALMAALNSLEVTDREARLYLLTQLTRREITSSKRLTAAEASQVLDTLKTVESREQLLAVIAEINQSGE